MRQLLPSPVDDVDPIEVFAADDRETGGARPWLMLNMVTSADGGISVDGTSGGLAGPADLAVFKAIRAVADVVVAASGTVIAENYGPPQPTERVRAMRTARGQDPMPRLAVVSNSLSIDTDHKMFDPEARPLVVTSNASPPDRREALSEVAEIIIAGDEDVDLALALDQLGERGVNVVLAEGGPTLNGALVADHLLDELCLTLSPKLIGGDGPRMVAGGDDADPPQEMRIVRILEEDDLTFHRFVRA